MLTNMLAFPFRQPSLRAGVLVLFYLFLSNYSASGAVGITEVNLDLRSVAYDPLTEKLYGVSPDSEPGILLQIDPQNGQVLQRFAVGGYPVTLRLDNANGLWIGMQGAVRRFRLDSFTSEDPISVETNSAASDIAISFFDPHTLAVTMLQGARGTGRYTTYGIRNGVVLPGTAGLQFVTMLGSDLFGQAGGDFDRAAIGANGVSPLFGAHGLNGWGDAEAYAGLVYHSSGYVFTAAKLSLAGGVHVAGSQNTTVAINKQTDQLFYLSGNKASWDLHRVERLTLRHTGLYSFPLMGPFPYIVPPDLAVWGTNRVAFSAAGKLFLLDVDQLFLPGDIAVSQSVSRPNLPWGTNVTFTVTVTNKGPGPAFDVAVTNLFPSGLVASGYLGSIYTNAVGAVYEVIPPGTVVGFQSTVTPKFTGNFESQVSVSTSNDPSPADNQSTLSIPVYVQTNGLSEIPLKTIDAAFDLASHRLFVYDGANIIPIFVEGPEILDPIAVGAGVAKIAIAPGAGLLYATFDTGALTTIDTHTLAVSSGGAYAPDVTFDMAVSPTNAHLVAISRASGTSLYKNGQGLPIRAASYGSIAFSADGSQLYLSNEEDCSLDVLRVSDAGLGFQVTRTNTPCGGFQVSNGLLYFDSGVIYDPAAGKKVSEIPVSSFPSLIAPDNARVVSFLTRTNGAWVLERLSATNLQLLAQVPLEGFTGSPADLIVSGDEELAIRTSTEIFLLNLKPEVPRLQAAVRTGDFVLHFSSLPGTHYRIESTDGLVPLQWKTVEEVNDKSGAIELHASKTNRSQFFRAGLLP
jgi:uncharacterized repeat protein (TIGR01451 family)